MAKDNNRFPGKNRLDLDVRHYSFCVYDYFDFYRKNGWKPLFNGHYYPAMVASCCDDRGMMTRRGFAHKSTAAEYRLTGMINEMESDFNNGQPITEWNSFRNKRTPAGYPLGQCAEQHAANELIFCEIWDNRINRMLNMKKEIYFSIAVRPSTGEVFDYCCNCKRLFDL